MLIAFLADLHQGYRAGRRVEEQSKVNLRELDGYRAFEAIVDDMLTVDGLRTLIIGGDIFHTPHPSVRTVLFVQRQFRRLSDAGFSIYALAGNHDVTDIRADLADSLLLHDPDRRIYSHIDPYVRYEVAPDVYVHLVSHHMYSEQSATMSQVRPVDGAVNILSTHGSIYSPLTQLQLRTNDAPREVVIPQHVYEAGWDYVMLGHIHERQYVQDGIYYNGSIIRRGFSDGVTELGRGWTLFELDSSGKFTVHPRTVAQRPQVDLPAIDAAGLSAAELTDVLVDNLTATRTAGGVFIPESAPILRQWIRNLTPAQHYGMDAARVQEASSHAFSYAQEKQWAVLTKDRDEKAADSPENGYTGTDMVQVFQQWSQDSEVLSTLQQDTREQVERQTEEFVRLGQDAMLDKEV